MIPVGRSPAILAHENTGPVLLSLPVRLPSSETIEPAAPVIDKAQSGKLEAQANDALQTIPRRLCYQTDLKMLGRSRIKDGWWGGAVEVQLDEQVLLMKRYDGPVEESRHVRVWFRGD